MNKFIIVVLSALGLYAAILLTLAVEQRDAARKEVADLRCTEDYAYCPNCGAKLTRRKQDDT